jgi:hypothetical protein
MLHQAESYEYLNGYECIIAATHLTLRLDPSPHAAYPVHTRRMGPHTARHPACLPINSPGCGECVRDHWYILTLQSGLAEKGTSGYARELDQPGDNLGSTCTAIARASALEIYLHVGARLVRLQALKKATT